MKSSQNEKTEYERRNYFFDTSALIKLYHHEEGTQSVERMFDQVICSIIISELATIEIYSGLARKLRMQEITKQAKHEAIQNFHKDCKGRRPYGFRLVEPTARRGRRPERQKEKDIQ